MSVYIDVFIIQNVIINYFLIMVTGRILKDKISVFKILIGSSLGVTYGVIALMMMNEIFSGLLVKLPVAFFMVFIAFHKKGDKIQRDFKRWGVFLLSSVVLVGAAVAIHISMGEGYIYRGMILNFNCKKIIGGIMLVLIFLERMLFSINKKRLERSFIYDCIMYKNDAKLMFKGLLDSGNFLCEPASGKSVIITEKNVNEYFGVEKEECYKIPFNSIGNSTKFLYAFEPDKFVAKGELGKSIEIRDVLVAYGENRFDEEFEGILPASVMIQLSE